MEPGQLSTVLVWVDRVSYLSLVRSMACQYYSDEMRRRPLHVPAHAAVCGIAVDLCVGPRRAAPLARQGAGARDWADRWSDGGGKPRGEAGRNLAYSDIAI